MNRPLQARNTITSNTSILAWVYATVLGEKDSWGEVRRERWKHKAIHCKLCGWETHQLKAVLAELLGDEECPEEREPDTPSHHLVHLLHIQHSEHKDELVEHKVPELVPHVLHGAGREREERVLAERRGGAALTCCSTS